LTGGEWVSSLALENLHSQHASVSEVAVVGAKDERRGERPVAFVVLRPEAAPADAPAALREHLRTLEHRSARLLVVLSQCCDPRGGGGLVRYP